MKLKVYIVGAAGLTGKELLGILAEHPGVEVVAISSEKHKGHRLASAFPDLEKTVYEKLIFESHDELLGKIDPSHSVVFLATPNETSLALSPQLIQSGLRVIDFSGAFRLKNLTEFEQYYNLKHTAADLNQEAIYGMPELFREKIKTARFIANPGCYPTGAILPLFFFNLVKKQKQLPEPLATVIDSKSGVSGAGGRVEGATFAFQNVYENFRAYKVLSHQHSPEIKQYARINTAFIFTPHLLPVYRGILSTISLPFSSLPVNQPGEIQESMAELCKPEPFIRFYSTPEQIELRNVQNTNYCDFALSVKDNSIVIVSAIDNLRKGAASQAVQNMNLMFNMDETTGLV